MVCTLSVVLVPRATAVHHIIHTPPGAIPAVYSYSVDYRYYCCCVGLSGFGNDESVCTNGTLPALFSASLPPSMSHPAQPVSAVYTTGRLVRIRYTDRITRPPPPRRKSTTTLLLTCCNPTAYRIPLYLYSCLPVFFPINETCGPFGTLFCPYCQARTHNLHSMSL